MVENPHFWTICVLHRSHRSGPKSNQFPYFLGDITGEGFCSAGFALLEVRGARIQSFSTFINYLNRSRNGLQQYCQQICVNYALKRAKGFSSVIVRDKSGPWQSISLRT